MNRQEITKKRCIPRLVAYIVLLSFIPLKAANSPYQPDYVGPTSVQNIFGETGTNSTKAAKPDLATADLGPSLRDQFKKSYRQLDEINAILQYLYQVFNKGSIQVPNKKKALAWIFDTQDQLKDLMHADESSIDALDTNLRTTKALCGHLSSIIQNNFKEWTPFEQPIFRSVRTDVSTYDFQDLFAENAKNIQQLRDAANSAGLTAVNIFARKLDDWNNRFNITGKLEKIPTICSLAYLGILLTPKEWLENVSILGYLKKKIGPEQNHPYTTISGWFGSDDYKGMERFAVAALASHAADNFLQKGIEALRPKLRSYWNGLKGMEVADESGYKYPDITLDDPRLIGLESQIKQMRDIVNYIADPESYDRSNSNLEKGILLTGPSRSGKTLLAEAVAGSCNELQRKKGDSKRFKFVSLKWDDIRWTPEGIKTIIKNAKQEAPLIFFIDEIHQLPLQTKEGQGDVLTQFLTMQETLLGESVIVMAATNRSYMLDDALLKYNRFGLIINFEEPSYANRKKFFEVYFKENAIDGTEFDIDALARQTSGASYGDLMSLFKNARFEARQDCRSVTQSDFQERIYRQIYRIQLDRKSPLNNHEKALVAVHQAGHALMYMLYESEIQEIPECVTIHGKWRKIVETRWFDAKESRDAHMKKKTKYGHMIASHKSEVLRVETDPELACKINLAGHIAEKILLGNTNYSYHQKDKRKALDHLEKIAFDGLKKEDYTKEEQKARCQKALQELKRCEQETYDILAKHQTKLENIALALERKELLTAAELRALMMSDEASPEDTVPEWETQNTVHNQAAAAA